MGGCRLEEAEEEQRVASWKPQSDDGHTYLQDIKTKLGQATAQNKNKHWSCLSKMEISDVREIFIRLTLKCPAFCWIYGTKPR